MSSTVIDMPTVRQTAEMTWMEAQHALLDGKRLRRLAWSGITSSIFMAGDVLHIRNADGTIHTLIVSAGDMQATDWVEVGDN